MSLNVITTGFFIKTFSLNSCLRFNYITHPVYFNTRLTIVEMYKGHELCRTLTPGSTHMPQFSQYPQIERIYFKLHISYINILKYTLNTCLV